MKNGKKYILRFAFFILHFFLFPSVHRAILFQTPLDDFANRLLGERRLLKQVKKSFTRQGQHFYRAIARSAHAGNRLAAAQQFHFAEKFSRPQALNDHALALVRRENNFGQARSDNVKLIHFLRAPQNGFAAFNLPELGRFGHCQHLTMVK